MPAPGKIKLIKFPPPGQEKTSNARGMPGGGGMLKLRFDWYITMQRFNKLNFLFALAVFRCLSNDIALKGFLLQHCVVFFIILRCDSDF